MSPPDDPNSGVEYLPNVVNFFQTWKSKTGIPPIFKRSMDEWTHVLSINNKDPKSDVYYKYNYLDDADLRSVVERVMPKHLQFYDKMRQNIERVDFCRYVLMYEYGGIYSDMDAFITKNPKAMKNINDNVTRAYKEGIAILTTEPIEHVERLYPHKLGNIGKINEELGNGKNIRETVFLCNAFIISAPKNEVWLDFIDYIIKHYDENAHKGAVQTTGPEAMTDWYENDIYGGELENNIVIEDYCDYNPIDASTNDIAGSCKIRGYKSKDDATVVHTWENSHVNNGLMRFLKRYWWVIIMIIILLALGYWAYKRGFLYA
jgi:hypothetical protein